MILSAQYANPSYTAAIMITDDLGAVLVSQIDTPELWNTLHMWGVPTPYVAPSLVPTSVTPLQARKALRIAGLKPAVDQFISTLSEEEREDWEYCIEVKRTDPTILKAATALGLTDDHLDQLFIGASQLD